MVKRAYAARWFLAIAVVGAIHQVGSTVQAGIMVSGGGIKKFGDPFYIYIVEVSLDPGFQVEPFDNFTLHELGGVHDPGSFTAAPGGTPSGPWATKFTNQPSGPLPNFSPPTIVPFADLEFINAGLDVQNKGTGEVPLGEFRVVTANSLPELPPSYFVDIAWTANIHDIDGNKVTDSGVVHLTLITPEPASLLMLGAGLGLPAALLYARRRRRTRST
jgi:hypothetical protein